MAGRQFSFFIGPSDQIGLQDTLRSSGDISFLNDWPLSSTPDEIETSVIQNAQIEPFRILIARKVDVPQIEFRPIKGREEFSCDPVLSPVVEFSRFPTIVANRFLRAGRLYRVDKYWNDDGKLVSKSPEFIEWSEHLYKLVKKSLIKVGQGCFAGAEALELRRSGICFEGLDMAIGSV